MLGWSGCSSTQYVPDAPLPSVPELTGAPHPGSYTLSDARSIFAASGAPSPEALLGCEAQVNKLAGLTQSKEELRQGVRELVRAHPIHYHYCFYRRMIQLSESVTLESSWRHRQLAVIDAYTFLVPVAHAFKDEVNDSRYLRWAVQQYAALSESVFYRKVELTPKMVMELVEISPNPYAEWRVSGKQSGGILEKYGMRPELPTVPVVSTGPSVPMVSPATPARSPAAVNDSVVPPQIDFTDAGEADFRDDTAQ